MRKIYPFIFILLVVTITAQSQKSLKVSENKFKLELYKVWGKSHAVSKKLLEKLPEICPELKDFEICGDDCNPEYTVEFFMSDPTVFEYRLQRTAGFPNTNTRNLVQYPIARLNFPEQQISPNNVLQPSSEKWTIVSSYFFQSFLLLRNRNNEIITKLVLVDTNEVWQTLRSSVINVNPNSRKNTPFSNIDDNPEMLIPPREEMVGIVERKILAL